MRLHRVALILILTGNLLALLGCGTELGEPGQGLIEKKKIPLKEVFFEPFNSAMVTNLEMCIGDVKAKYKNAILPESFPVANPFSFLHSVVKSKLVEAVLKSHETPSEIEVHIVQCQDDEFSIRYRYKDELKHTKNNVVANFIGTGATAAANEFDLSTDVIKFLAEKFGENADRFAEELNSSTELKFSAP